MTFFPFFYIKIIQMQPTSYQFYLVFFYKKKLNIRFSYINVTKNLQAKLQNPTQNKIQLMGQEGQPELILNFIFKNK